MSEKLNQKGPVPGPDRQMLRRTLFLMAVCGVAVFLALLARLWKIQIVDHDFYQQLALSQQLRQVPGSAARGTIYDAKGNVLAVSASVDTVYLSPAEIELYGEDKELIASKLSEILDLDYEEILEKASRTGSWYVTVARKIEREQAELVRAFKNEYALRGVRLEADTKRYYPNSSLACHLIGFVGTDNYGLEGIEARYDEALSGTAGRSLRATNAFGTDLLFSQFEEYLPGEDGLSAVTTIDSTIQFYVEKQLRQAVEDYDIQNGAGAIAMNVNTGAVLAMASLDGYDLNHFLDVSEEARAEIEAAESPEEAEKLLGAAQIKQWRNKALSDTYEPGSTFKALVLAAALEEGVVSENDTFDCPGYYNIGGWRINCSRRTGHGHQTLAEAVQNSCNPAFIEIGQRLGAEKFYEYFQAFGMTEKTGIDLPGEEKGVNWGSNMGIVDLAVASFGQRFNVTPLQMVTGFSAVINGGNLYQPYVVQKVTDSEGNTVKENSSTLVRQVVSEQTSQRARAILETVVSEGGGSNAYQAGYRIGGKTGSAETLEDGRTIVSFMGFAPADDPQVIVLMAYDTPKEASPGSSYGTCGVYISGGAMAAPRAGELIAQILDYMGVEKQYTTEESAATAVTTPQVTGYTVADAATRLEKKNLTYRTVGTGDVVTSQVPAANSAVPGGSTVILYLGDAAPEETTTVPNVVGMSYEGAKKALEAQGLFMQAAGSSTFYSESSKAQSQSVAAGESVATGTIVQVQFSTLVEDGAADFYEIT